MCIVRANFMAEYAALSYVWGVGNVFQTEKHNLRSLMQVGGIKEAWDKLPATIQDAITVTKQIGLRFDALTPKPCFSLIIAGTCGSIDSASCKTNKQ